jgi:hypothetical protein
MKNDKKSNLSEEHLRKIKYRFGYKINETARYSPLTKADDIFDEVPAIKEAGDQEDATKPGGGATPPEPTNDQPLDMNAPPAGGAAPIGEPPPEGGELPKSVSASGKETPEDNPEVNPEMGADPMADPMAGGAVNPMGADMNPQGQVDDIQNDIIKHNIEAMKSINDQLQSLDKTTQDLNAKLDSLNADVEEVREPTNSEKLMSKTNVSYPYYFNLNDFWSGNWFDQKHQGEKEKGVRELPDGSFIADFDDLPQKSKQDVQSSFNEFN